MVLKASIIKLSGIMVLIVYFLYLYSILVLKASVPSSTFPSMVLKASIIYLSGMMVLHVFFLCTV
jgi:hypothetical protein